MKAQTVCRQVMSDKQVRQIDVAEKSGYGQTSVAMWLKSNSMRVENFLKILDACGYDLVVMDRDGSHPSYRVSNEDGLDVVNVGMKTVTDSNDQIAKAVEEALRARGL